MISEGKTGGVICNIHPDSTDSQYVKSHKDIDAYLGVYHQIDKYYKHERLRQIIDKMVEDGKLSPRYTEPDKKRPPKIKEANLDNVFSKCLYEKGKKYFIRIYNQDSIQLFKRKDSGNDSYFTVYAPSNGWMMSLGSAGNMDDYIRKLKDGLDLHAWLLESYEKQIANPTQWADPSIADYLGRREEADEHNAPIKAARDEIRMRDDEKRENERISKEQAEAEKYDSAIAKAVNAIRNKETVNNDDIETMPGNVTSIILELMRIYKIEVPLKTKGWINSALAKIFYEDDGYTYSYYRKSRNSGVFRDCLDKLVYAVNELF
jgi:hypothetical protein